MARTCPECFYPIPNRGCDDGCDHRTHCDCESAKNHVSLDTIEDYDLSCGRTVKRHAVERWRTRNNLNPPCNIGEAWETAVPVGAERVNGATARLYSPADLVLVAHNGAVRTALRREWVGELSTDHLKTCEWCENLWHPEQTDECPWCDGKADSGGLSIRSLSPMPSTRVERGRLHECPVDGCTEQTLGDGDDERCKVCREVGRRVDGEQDRYDEPETCAECFAEPEPGSDYCELHSFLTATGGIHAE